MWELILFFVAMGVFALVMEYWLEPRKLLRELGIFRGTHDKVTALEARVEELERVVRELKS